MTEILTHGETDFQRIESAIEYRSKVFGDKTITKRDKHCPCGRTTRVWCGETFATFWHAHIMDGCGRRYGTRSDDNGFSGMYRVR